MTVTQAASSHHAGSSAPSGHISSSAKSSRSLSGASSAASGQQQAPSYSSFGSPSIAFQQVKQTQASLARLSRVHQQQQQQQQQQVSHTNQSSQQVKAADPSNQQPAARCTTFIDCLIRRFKDCFNEDCCTVPMFVVGNLSPGSDGTHLILPPCVSLGRQNINRFAGPKNLRLLNSIRESCRSIEELDLGGNKLTDLIEVYKILQCTPNLKFLNLSENDLSKTSPVALAATCSSFSSSTTPNYSSSIQASASSSGGAHQNWSPSSVTIGGAGHRTLLGPINQNQSPQQINPLTPPSQQRQIGARRHSTLGQTTAQPTMTTTARTRPASSRLTDARRMAAAAAVAQSKKTSSSVASKLTNSATVSGSLVHRSASGRADGANVSGSSSGSPTSLDQIGTSASQRRQTGAASTMHLARSLSSLSAKDVRAASSSLSRLSSHRPMTRKASGLRGPTSCDNRATSKNETMRTSKTTSDQRSSAYGKPQAVVNSSKDKLATSSGHKLFVEPIDETDDVDMGEQSGTTGANANDTASSNVQQANASVSQVASSQQAPAVATATTTTTSRALGSLQTGNASSSLTNKSCAQSQTSANNCTQQSANFRRTFESIKALALNNTGCQWRVVSSILSRMPNLEELHLSLNNYERIDLEPNEFKHPSLKRLYLCNNPKLTNWEELDKLLIAFPSLEALSIADCNISQIPENLDRAREWRKLCGLNINGWPIKEWPVIERLNQLPSLIDLKCRNLEILNTIDEPRHHLIARLPKLQRLNGSEIEEREHAEKAFLRFFMANSHLERPSRFHELVQIHGEITSVDVDVDLSPPSQAHVRVVYLNRNHFLKEDEDDIIMSEDFLIKLMDNVEEPSNNLDSMEVADASNANNANVNDCLRLFKDEGQEVVAIDVDLRQSVRKFKSTLASLFGLSSQNLILYYIDHEMVGLMGPELIKHNQKKLWNYNVQDGDQFIVEER